MLQGVWTPVQCQGFSLRLWPQRSDCDAGPGYRQRVWWLHRQELGWKSQRWGLIIRIIITWLWRVSYVCRGVGLMCFFAFAREFVISFWLRIRFLIPVATYVKRVWYCILDERLTSVLVVVISAMIPSDKAFVFSLKNVDKPYKMAVQQSEQYYATGNRYSVGPTFGWGDFYIANSCATTTGSVSDLGATYELPAGYVRGTVETRSLLAGSPNFKCDEYEVFYQQ